MRFIGQNKALAVKRLLGEDFPHTKLIVYDKRFEQLTTSELAKVLNADLIISAGIDFDGDTSLDVWRRGLERPPAHICTWIEAFAVGGHAALLYGSKSLLTAFDEHEQPTFRLTDWPVESNALHTEAGCGNIFQPHGVVDLQPTITIATRLAIDMLRGAALYSCRRVWLGDLEAVAANGGSARSSFTESRVMKEYPWS